MKEEKKNVQSHYKSWLVRKSKDEESFFNITKVVVNDQAKEIVHVKDVQEYISHVIRCRGVDEDDCLIKIGGDTGGDYLKITMNIIDLKKLENPGSIPAGENENGVKKLKIIAIVYKGVENYNLVKAVLDLLNLPGIYLNWKATGDQKYINIVLGLQSHTASFPCPYCLTHKSFLTVNPEHRTFGHLRREAELSAEDQDPRSHFSVKNQPLLPFPDDTPVLSAVPPPELHLTLRSFNHVWNKMGTAWQQHLEETGEDLPWFSHPDPATQALDPASKFALHHHVVSSSYHGHAMTGDKVLKLLQPRITEDLQRKLPESMVNFVEYFNSLFRVTQSCFSVKGPESDAHLQDLLNFEEKFSSLLTIDQTPTIHSISNHVLDFYELEGTKYGLGLYGEQCCESVHYDFESHIFVHGFKRDPSHPDHGKFLLRAVAKYNNDHS